ncbi:MAG TPA: AzlD domain-containing protein [Acetobacteraceae bacterium]
MTLDPWVLAAIGAMALATYLTRAGGYWLFRVISPPPVVRAMLGYIPGTLFVSYVVPALAEGGLQQWAGAAATLAVMLATRNLALAILGGTAAAAVIWAAS